MHEKKKQGNHVQGQVGEIYEILSFNEIKKPVSLNVLLKAIREKRILGESCMFTRFDVSTELEKYLK